MRLAPCVLAALLVAPACRDDGKAGGRPPASPAPGTGGVLEGTVLRATEHELRVDPVAEGAAPVTLRLVPGIPIRVDGRVTAWSLIPEGAHVRAEWMTEEGHPVALSIDATTHAPPPAAAPASPGRSR